MEEKDETIELRQTELEALKEEYDKYKENILYQLAEQENIYKRKAKTAEMQAERKVETLLNSAVSILDDMESMMFALQSEASEHAVGLAHIYKKFLRELQNIGCEQIETKEVSFNSDVHEAISVEQSEKESGSIISCVRNGYIYNNKLLRAAKVRIAQ